MKRLIIITRIHAQPGTCDDEFTQYWGGQVNTPKLEFGGLENSDFSLLVINGPYFYHGQGKPQNKLPSDITPESYYNSIKKLLDSYNNEDEIMILYHPQVNFPLDHFILEDHPNAICAEFSGSGTTQYFYNNIYIPLAKSARNGQPDEQKIQELWDYFDVLPKSIQLHKKIVLERLKGEKSDSDLLKALKNGSSPFNENHKVTYEQLSEKKGINKNILDSILDYINREVMEKGD